MLKADCFQPHLTATYLPFTAYHLPLKNEDFTFLTNSLRRLNQRAKIFLHTPKRHKTYSNYSGGK
jgi:hypothetical protein